MKNLLMIGCLLFFSCKNSGEKSPSAENSEEEDTITLTWPLPNLVKEGMEVAENDDEPEEEKSESPKNIFNMGSHIVFVEKESLNDMERSQWESLMEENPKLSSDFCIVSDESQYQIDLSKLQSQLKGSEETLESFKALIEQNITHGSISMGYQKIGLERLKKFTELPEGGFLENLVSAYDFKSRRESQTIQRRLGVVSEKNFSTILLEYLGITLEELDLLKDFPMIEKIYNSEQANDAIQYKPSAEVLTHLKEEDCTQGFKDIVAFFEKKQTKEPSRFLQNARKAKEEFYKLNPGWYGENDDKGVTYIDSRKKYIYLPFGALSFADRVVSYHAEGTEGQNLEGALGVPNMALEDFRTAHPNIGNLGEKGVLTIEFMDNTLTNVHGPDLYVFEMGKIEPTLLEISKDGKEWIDIGKIEGGTAMVDIEGFVPNGATFNYVRLTDLDTFSTVPGADIDAIAAIGGALRLNLDSSVLFDTGKFELKESASAALEALVRAVAEIPNGDIIVEGHTDNVGSPQSNQVLSEKRAQEVANYLRQHLPNNYTYKMIGLGETQPVAPNDSEENKQKNRRVEILVVPSN